MLAKNVISTVTYINNKYARGNPHRKQLANRYL